MTEDHEVPGLTLFDERATAVGEFSNAVLGYDKQAVDAYVRQLERQVLELRRQAREQTTENDDQPDVIERGQCVRSRGPAHERDRQGNAEGAAELPTSLKRSSPDASSILG